MTRALNIAGAEPGVWRESDISHLGQRYGYGDRNPPNVGNLLSDLQTLGAGRTGNNRRYVHGGTEGFGCRAIESKRALPDAIGRPDRPSTDHGLGTTA